MEGRVSLSMLNYLDKYTVQIFIFLLGMLLIITGVLLFVWISNRRKFHQFKHQIPSSVLKNYLDSIIQNSTALKSSLFRGGGLDVEAGGVPSVLPLDQLKQGAAFDAVSAGGDEELRAEINRLQNALSDKNTIIKDLETAKIGLEGENKSKSERIVELEKLLETLKNEPGESGDSAKILAEKNALELRNKEIEEQLKEYEIIGDDLANLKKIKQENEQLKQALADMGQSAPAAPQVDPDETPIVEPKDEMPQFDDGPRAPAPSEQQVVAEETSVKEEAPAEEPVAEKVANESTSNDSEEEQEPVNTKSPEDLLSEFEKMLG